VRSLWIAPLTRSLRSRPLPASGERWNARFALAADGLAVAVAASLPWSTSATAILIVVWLCALLPTLEAATLRRVLASPAGGLPVLLYLTAVLGMLWADVSWSERLHGLGGFHKLLVIPLLLAQFSRSPRGHWVLYGFLAGCVALLLASWVLMFAPGLTWRGKEPGVPVKDYIAQSTEFLICAFALAAVAFDRWRQQRRFAVAAAVLTALFFVNILYVATGRTALVVIPVLVLILGFRQLGWKGIFAAGLGAGVIAGLVWVTSPYVRAKVQAAIDDIRGYQESNAVTSAGVRLEFYRKSLLAIAQAPVLGHGTGSVRATFARIATGEGATAATTHNPHSQYFGVAVQLGLLGLGLLVAMWIAHLLLFRGGSLVAWIGTVMVVQNVVSSLFNSHLFDFGHGWLYVFGVGVAGGMMLRAAKTEAGEPRGP
jgi:O-antigen ligase